MNDRELAKSALDVQDACNLSGVVHEFSRVMKAMSDRGFDIDEKNTHPVSVLFASKIASLTGCEYGLEFSRAYEWAARIVQLSDLAEACRE